MQALPVRQSQGMPVGCWTVSKSKQIDPENAALGARMRDAMEAARLTQEEVGGALGLKQQSVGQWLTGQTRPTHRNLVKFSQLTGTSIDKLSGADENPSQQDGVREPSGLSSYGEVRRIPLISWVAASSFSEANDPFMPGDGEKYVLATDVSDRAFALQVRGPSMEPEFRDGSVIIVDPRRQAKSGDFVVVRLNDANEATFKQLYIEAGVQWLRPLNPQFPALQINGEAQMCGVVVEQLKKY